MRSAIDRLALPMLRFDLDRAAIVVVTAAFTVIAIGNRGGSIDLGGLESLLWLFPALLAAIDVFGLGGSAERDLRAAAAWSAVVLLALWLTPLLIANGLVAVGVPIAVGVAVACARRPAAGVVGVALLSCVMGSFQAFLGVGPSALVDLILAALWLVVAARVVLGRPYEAFAIWPAILGASLYLALSAVDVLTSREFGAAVTGFRETGWYMLAFLAIAYAGWERATYRRLATGLVAMATLVAGYACLRWIIGPAGPEEDLARGIGLGINIDPVDKHLRTVGSFSTTHQLAFWGGFMAPYCAGIAFWKRGWTRRLALLATLLCGLSVIASEARGPLVGLAVGMVLVLVLYQASRAFPGAKVAVVGGAVLGALAIGAGAIALSTSNPDQLERYMGILEPTEDPTFAQRQIKWDAIWPEIEAEPLGHGLGTASGGRVGRRFVSVASVASLDNSYLKVGYEQGIVVMVLFAVVLLGILIGLSVATLRTRSREAASFGLAAAGSLASILVSFYTGLYVEAPPVLVGWVIVGLGLSYFVARMRRDSEQRPAPPAGSR